MSESESADALMGSSQVPGDVTKLLASLGSGRDDEVYERLLPLIQDELRRLASAMLSGERTDHTLQPTALVNEVFLKLAGQHRTEWKSRGHFLAIAAIAMRRILVDHARGQLRRARDADRGRMMMNAGDTAAQVGSADLLALDEAMNRLARIDPRKVTIVELRFFIDLTVDQMAEAMGLSTATVKREWRLARMWLKAELSGDG